MENSTKQEAAKETSRIEAFSDGVFAIAITLLVLDIHVPAVKGDESLLQPIVQQWPTFLAFLVGFFTILICWINHHYMFQHIHRSDATLLLVNGSKLLVVSFTPFATALLAKYINTPHFSTAVSIYAGNFAFMGITMFGIWAYATKRGFNNTYPLPELKATTQLYIFAGVCSTTIFLLSFVTTLGALLLSVVMFFIFLFPKGSVALLMNRNRNEAGVKV